MEDHPLSVIRHCLFNILAATLHTGGCCSIRNLRTRHAVCQWPTYRGLPSTKCLIFIRPHFADVKISEAIRMALRITAVRIRRWLCVSSGPGIYVEVRLTLPRVRTFPLSSSREYFATGYGWAAVTIYCLFSFSGQGQVMGYCECGNEPSRSIKCEEFLD